MRRQSRKRPLVPSPQGTSPGREGSATPPLASDRTVEFIEVWKLLFTSLWMSPNPEARETLFWSTLFQPYFQRKACQCFPGERCGLSCHLPLMGQRMLTSLTDLRASGAITWLEFSEQLSRMDTAIFPTSVSRRTFSEFERYVALLENELNNARSQSSSYRNTTTTHTSSTRAPTPTEAVGAGPSRGSARLSLGATLRSAHQSAVFSGQTGTVSCSISTAEPEGWYTSKWESSEDDLMLDLKVYKLSDLIGVASKDWWKLARMRAKVSYKRRTELDQVVLDLEEQLGMFVRRPDVVTELRAKSSPSS